MSKRLIVVGIAGAIAILGVLGTATAQKMHAPKAEWMAMVAGLSDIQDMTASLMVFNMDRIATTADELAQREQFISEIASLPDDVKEGHAKVAQAAEELAGAALTGEEQEVTAGIADVIAACNTCHYDVRDEKRRQKLQ